MEDWIKEPEWLSIQKNNHGDTKTQWGTEITLCFFVRSCLCGSKKDPGPSWANRYLITSEKL